MQSWLKTTAIKPTFILKVQPSDNFNPKNVLKKYLISFLSLQGQHKK